MRRTLGAAAALLLVLLLLPRLQAAAQNLAVNPHFDTSVAGWAPTSGPLTWDGTRDADGNPSSGSAQAGSGGGLILDCFQIVTQCITAVTPGQVYQFGGKLFIPPGQLAPGNVPVLGGAYVSVAWSADLSCSLTPILSTSTGPSFTATSAWFSSAGFTSPPPGALSAQLQGSACHTLGNGTLLVNFDDMFFQPAAVAVVPALDGRGLAAFALLLAAAGLLRRGRRRLRV